MEKCNDLVETARKHWPAGETWISRLGKAEAANVTLGRILSDLQHTIQAAVVELNNLEQTYNTVIERGREVKIMLRQMIGQFSPRTQAASERFVRQVEYEFIEGYEEGNNPPYNCSRPVPRRW